MRGKWIKWSKISLLLVCVGFFMPVSCGMNGIQLAKMFYRADSPAFSILIFLVLLGAAFSVVISIAYHNKLDKESIFVDWICIATSISGGIFSIGIADRSYFNLEFGVYMIIAGWILSIIFLILASVSKKE